MDCPSCTPFRLLRAMRASCTYCQFLFRIVTLDLPFSIIFLVTSARITCLINVVVLFAAGALLRTKTPQLAIPIPSVCLMQSVKPEMFIQLNLLCIYIGYPWNMLLSMFNVWVIYIYTQKWAVSMGRNNCLDHWQLMQIAAHLYSTLGWHLLFTIMASPVGSKSVFRHNHKVGAILPWYHLVGM